MKNQLFPNQNTEESQWINYPIWPPNAAWSNTITDLENKLLKICGIKPGLDMQYENIPISDNKLLYIHTLKSSTISPDKPNFIFIHGYIGSSNNFIRLCPYLMQYYNWFIPDTIGMALSSRPQVEFTSTEQCTNYFIDIIEKWRWQLNLSSFYLSGHSLGGYFAGSYALKYPENVIKVLWLSPAGVTNPELGGNIFKEAGCCVGCGMRMWRPLWSCKPRFQALYKWKIIKPLIKFIFRIRYQINGELNEIISKWSEIAMEYPSDLDACMWYIFKNPFPQGASPIEERLWNDTRLNCVICFGEKDWMDQAGSRRWMAKDETRFKVIVISKYSHVFILENPKEWSEVILNHFPCDW